MSRAYLLSLSGGIVLAGSAFLPWLRIGDVGLPGIPDPAGLFVLGISALGILFSLAGIFTRRDTHPWLVLAGLASLTTLVVVWLTGPATIADRARARAEAVALVDNVAMQPVPPVGVGIGLVLGLAGAAAVTGVGLTGVWSRGTGER